MNAARAFGIAYQVGDPILKKLKEYKIDLEDASGRDHHQLPVPSVFLIDGEKRIFFQYVNPDYKVRLSGKILRAAAEALQEK